MELQEALAEIEGRGGCLAAISVDPVERSQELIARLAAEEGGARLGFPLLSDPGGATAKAYGAYDPAHRVALPATIVVSRSGEVEWKRVGGSIADRPTRGEALAVLDRAVAGVSRRADARE